MGKIRDSEPVDSGPPRCDRKNVLAFMFINNYFLVVFIDNNNNRKKRLSERKGNF
jgi:hypothetical protein